MSDMPGASRNRSDAGFTEAPRTVPDYIGGEPVRATREETEAVQPFARRLVEDFGYHREQIQTHPQYRIRRSPSDEARSYPVDIAVFRSGGRTEGDLLMVVECKKPNVRTGRRQLERYLDMCAAEVGVWFNGEEHLYLHRTVDKQGRVAYATLPNIPRRGQRVADVGRYLRRDLAPPSNLKAVFRDVRNHLAGMTTGITRDEALAQEIINLLFCKLLDESNTAPGDPVTFRAGTGEAPATVAQRIDALFAQVKEEVYGDVFQAEDRIRLDPASVVYVVGELQTYCLMEADRDAIGDAFEVFIGPALRGAEGQFFTPRNVVELIVRMIDPRPLDKVLDPACGSGGFLITALSHVWAHLQREGQRKAWTRDHLLRRQAHMAHHQFKGIDKDAFLARVCKAYMALIGDGRSGVFCQNTLEARTAWAAETRTHIDLGAFDVVVTNPPFGKKIVVEGEDLLAQYELAHRWRWDAAAARWVRTEALRAKVPPQIVFLERCVRFLKPGGRLGIVMPESIFGNPSHRHIVHWLLEHVQVQAVVTMPEALFKTSGKGGTHTRVCVLIAVAERAAAGEPIFMGEVEWCGHDSRGNPTLRERPDGTVELLDEVPEVAERYARWRRDPDAYVPHRLGFPLPRSEVRDNILIPRYYDPTVASGIRRLEHAYEFVALGELEAQGVLSLGTGVEVGKMAYGTGRIPFIRTSDLSNWEIKTDFKHGVSEAVYERHRSRADVAEHDILMVKDGTYLVGHCAIVTRFDLPMLFQSHLYRIRVEQPERLSPWLLLALLTSPVVRRQMRARQFTQDIIDTLGPRVRELEIPLPRSEDHARSLADRCRHIVETRVALRQSASDLVAALDIIDPDWTDPDGDPSGDRG